MNQLTERCINLTLFFQMRLHLQPIVSGPYIHYSNVHFMEISRRVDDNKVGFYTSLY